MLNILTKIECNLKERKVYFYRFENHLKSKRVLVFYPIELAFKLAKTLNYSLC